MRLFDFLEAFLVIGPILGLLLVGFLVSLQSGVAGSSSPHGVGLFLGSLSRVLIRVVGYVAGLLAVQYIVGFPLGLAF
jgi:hypothetical protein